MLLRRSEPAGIEYVGQAGVSATCLAALFRLLQTTAGVSRVLLLSCEGVHAFLLTTDGGALVAIKAGFASGYGGEGPRTLATAIQLLRHHRLHPEERDVSPGVLDRLNESALTVVDLAAIEAAPRTRPVDRWLDYVDAYRLLDVPLGHFWQDLELVMPYSMIDIRLADLALDFFSRPNECLLQGFRRLESLVRERIGSAEVGAKLFSQAFIGDTAPLSWPDLVQSEVVGRVALFTGAYMAYRNPRAHADVAGSTATLLGEFLVLNELFRFEGAARDRKLQ